MRPVAVVVVDVLVDNGFEMPSPDDQHPIEALPADRADEAPGKCIGTRCPDRDTDGSDALGVEYLVEAGRELCVAIPDQEPDRTRSVGQVHGEVPRLLDHPRSGWVSGDSGHVHPSGVEFDEEQDVEPPQKHGVHGEEVAGQHRGGLDLQELTPGRPGSVRGGVEAVTLEDVPDARRCQADAQDGELTLDPSIAPCRVLPG